jgi:hypothetical protein
MGFSDSKGVYHTFRSALLLSLFDLREVSSGGDVSNVAGNGGLLASDTTPVLRGNAAETQELSWEASNSDIVAAQVALPEDFDGREDVLVELWVNSGTTDAASFTVESGWDGAALVSDTATDSAKSATTHKITATISAADIPDEPSFLTLILTPAAHTTDAIQLLNARVSYVAKQL